MLKAPFPFFGGKASVASKVWAALGQPKHYLEPFFGSGAVLLARPNYDQSAHVETICDADGFIANVWRALRADPDEVAKWCDWPVNHADLSARKRRLSANEARLLEHLIADDEWFDAKLAGYWVWAACCWIGSGLTSPNKRNQRPHLTDAGMGVHAISTRPRANGTDGDQFTPKIYDWFRALSERLRRVRVVCGDWTRVCGGHWQDRLGACGIFFDPPYGVNDRDQGLYHRESTDIARDVRAWALERGANPDYRIVIAGYDEHGELLEHGWRAEGWKTGGGYAHTRRADTSQGDENRTRERLYCSPHCLGKAMSLFSGSK